MTFTPDGDGESEVIFSGGYQRDHLFEGRLHFESEDSSDNSDNSDTLAIIEVLQAQDSGVFTIRDNQDNLVMVVTLEMAGEWPSTSCLSGGPAFHALLIHRIYNVNRSVSPTLSTF